MTIAELQAALPKVSFILQNGELMLKKFNFLLDLF